MDRTLRTRTMIFAGILAFSVLYLLPTVAGSSLPSWYFFSKKINLGLDLKGGARFVYSIDLDAAVDDKASEIKRDLDVKLAEKDLAATVSTPRSLAGALTIKPTDAAKRADIEKLVMSEYKDIIATRACSAKEGEAVCVRISTKFADDVRRRALSQAVKTVEERVNAEGVAEPTVIQKDDQIIVEMPGLAEEATVRVQETIARTAKLEFKIVANDDPVMKAIYKHVGSAESPVDPEGIKQGIKAYDRRLGRRRRQGHPLRLLPDRQRPEREADRRGGQGGRVPDREPDRRPRRQVRVRGRGPVGDPPLPRRPGQRQPGDGDRRQLRGRLREGRAAVG
jgi:preprotein translocase subunit SecD